MWDLPGPGLEPVSSPLAGGFLTTVPPGKSRVSDLRVFIQTPEIWLQSEGSLVTLPQRVKPSAWGRCTVRTREAQHLSLCCYHCWNYHHDHFSQSTHHLPPVLMEHHCLCHLQWLPSREAFLSATVALYSEAASTSPLSPTQNSAISRPRWFRPGSLCIFTSNRVTGLILSKCTSPTPLPVFDSPGIGDLQGCGRDLYPGGVGTA